MVNLTGVLTSVVISLTGAPLVLMVSNHDVLSQPLYLMIIGFSLLTAIALLFKMFLSPSALKFDKSLEGRGLAYYTYCVFMFGCVADFTLQCCHNKLFTSLFTCGENSYLLNGEPYLQTQFGITTQFWNAIVNYFLQLLAIYQIDNHIDCRITTLYWCGSIITSQFVVLVGGLSGSFSNTLEYAVWLNVIFIGLPLLIFCKFLGKPIVQPGLITAGSSKSLSIKESKLNLFEKVLSVLLVCSMCFNLIRGLGALGSRLPFIAYYVNNYEPYINEPAKFGSTWVLYTALYVIPFYVATLCNLSRPVLQWAVNLSIFFAAGLLQGTFVYLSYSWYPSSNPEFRISNDSMSVVLSANVFLVITAHLLMFHHLQKYRYFTKQLQTHEKSKKKKS